MVENITDNPQFIINGFIRSGITSAIDGVVDVGSANEDSGTEEDVNSADSEDCEESDEETAL